MSKSHWVVFVSWAGWRRVLSRAEIDSVWEFYKRTERWPELTQMGSVTAPPNAPSLEPVSQPTEFSPEANNG